MDQDEISIFIEDLSYVSVHLGFTGEDSNMNRETTDNGCQVMTKAHTLEKTKCTISRYCQHWGHTTQCEDKRKQSTPKTGRLNLGARRDKHFLLPIGHPPRLSFT